MPARTTSTSQHGSATDFGKDIIVINDVPLRPVEVDGQRVVTLSMVDRVHGRPDGTARKRFNDNRDRFVEGKHFFVRNSDEAAELGVTAPNGLTVMTERGYLMLVKSFTDDLAWKVQDALVESYFVKASVKTSPMRGARIEVNREHRLTMQQTERWAKMAGLTGNQALLAANRATTAMTGIDTLRLMGITHMDAPTNEALMSPTDLGLRFGLGSGRAVNLLLSSFGLQVPFRDAKGHLHYEPTEAGKRAGGVMQDTGKHHGNGVPVRQLRWPSSIGAQLLNDNSEHQAIA